MVAVLHPATEYDREPKLTAALWAIELGCSIRMLAPGLKRPYSGEAGSRFWTTDPHRAETWLSNRPASNVAIALGDRLHVIDLDPRNYDPCLLYTSPSPRDQRGSRMPSSA